MRVEVARISTGLSTRRPDLRPSAGTSLVGPWQPDWIRAAGPYLRTPSRVYRNVAQSPETRLEPLFEDLRAQLAAARSRLGSGRSFSVEVVDARAVQAGPLQVRGVVKNAVLGGLRGRVDPARPEVRWSVRRKDQTTVLSMDLLGPLSHRGYRRPGAAAPLREHLAAQLVALSGWHPDREPLVDPMCGTGTLLLEAWGWARGVAARAPGGPALFPDVDPVLVGMEVDPETLREAKATLRKAGARGADLRAGPADQVHLPPGPGLVLTNPPYGERLPRNDAWQALNRLRARAGDWRFGVLGPRSEVVRCLGDRPNLDKPLPNGPLDTHFFVYGPGR